MSFGGKSFGKLTGLWTVLFHGSFAIGNLFWRRVAQQTSLSSASSYSSLGLAVLLTLCTMIPLWRFRDEKNKAMGQIARGIVRPQNHL